MSVQIGNDWDEILKDEWKKDYYIRLRKNLINEYKNYNFNESINLITKIKKKKKVLIFLKKIRNKLSLIVKKWKIC